MTRLPESTLHATEPAGSGRRAPKLCSSAWLCWGFVWGVSLWLLEGALFTSTQPERALEVFQAGSAILFFYELLGITTATVLALWWAGVTGGRTTAAWFASVSERWRELEMAPLEVRRTALAYVYAAVSVVPGCLWLAYYAARDTALRVANRDNLGLALVGIQVGALLFGFAAVRVAQRGVNRALARVTRAADTTRRERFYRLGWHVRVVLGLCLAITTPVLIGFSQPLAESLRHFAAPLTLGLLGAAGVAKLAPRLSARPRVRRALSPCIITLCVSSGVTGALVRQATPPGWANAPVARIALGWGHFWLDWDRDRHLAGFGERDCRPFDSSIHPGALDAPGNRTDEDCDGVDAMREPWTSGKPKRAPAGSLGAPADGVGRPNLYLLTVDGLAVWTLEAYGGKRGLAPALDRFAEHAVVFENFFVQGPSTRLSLPALFTSRFDSRIDHVLQGRFPFELAPSNRLLAEVLAEAGYETLAVIPSPYFAPEHWRGLLQGFRSVATRPAEAYASGTPHTAQAVTDAALAFLDRPQLEPVFLWAHYFDAHPPHAPPEGQQASGSTDAALYATEVTHLDAHLGRLIDHIVASDPNHVIVVTSDHGMAFDEPRHQHEHYGYDLSTPVLHVPFMVRAATLTPRRLTHLTDALDVAPTLTALAGVRVPESFMGNDLVPLLSDKNVELPRVRFAQFYLGEEVLRGRDPLVMVAARTASHNLVLDRRTGLLAAWAWQEDPEERRDRWPSVREALADHRATLPRSIRSRSDEIAELQALKRALDAHLYEALAPPSPRSHQSHNETRP